MLKKLVFYPVLFALNPVLLLFSANVSDLPLSSLFPSVILIPLICIGLFLILFKALKDSYRAGFIVFLLELWFFHYGTVHLIASPYLAEIAGINSHWLLLPIWSLLFFCMGSKWLWRSVRSPQTITAFLNTVAAILVLFSTARIILDIVPRYTQRHLEASAIQALPSEDPTLARPDIYYLIIDGYARQDVLATMYHYDNSSFIAALEKRGFQVPSDSKTNYMQTALSLASSLNMDYLRDVSPTLPDRGQLIGRISHSQVRIILEQWGYQTITFSSGYLPTEITDAEVSYAPKGVNNHDFEALLMINTILKPFYETGWLDLPIARYQAQQERILYTFEHLSNLPPTSAPKFIFAHLIIPHPPFIFDANGAINPDEFYILADGDRLGGSYQANQAAYVEQVKFTNGMILQTIDRILDHSSTPPIIIIQADHGPGIFLDTASVEDTCLYERFSIFSAFYLPEQGRVTIPDDITPVNIFRLIFNAYWEANFELLPNQQYFSTWAHPYQFSEVTLLTNIPCVVP